MRLSRWVGIIGLHITLLMMGIGGGYLLWRQNPDHARQAKPERQMLTASARESLQSQPEKTKEKRQTIQFPIYEDVVPPIPQVHAQHDDQMNDQDQLREAPQFIERKIPILMYHYIRDYHDPEDPLGQHLSVSPENLKKQLQAVRDQGFTAITLTDLAGHMYFQKKIPEKPIIITFDDGYDDAFTNAFPILKEMNMIGSFAIITGFVGNPGYLTWEQIRQMHASGQEMVSHTVHHADLARTTDAQLLAELQESKFTLDMMLGQKTVALVYPSGQFDIRVQRIAQRLGYLVGRGTGEGDMVTRGNVFSLPVMRMGNDAQLTVE